MFHFAAELVPGEVSLPFPFALPASEDSKDGFPDFGRLYGTSNAVLVEQDEIIVHVSDRYAKTLGYGDARELIGRSVSSVIAPADQARMLEYGRRRSSGEPAPTTYRFQGQRRDGTSVNLQAEISTLIRGDRFFITTHIQPVILHEASPEWTEFTDLYETSAPIVYALLLRILRNESDAQQVLEETFLQVWRERHRLQTRSSRARSLLTTARSRALERAREVRTQRSLVPSPADAPAPGSEYRWTTGEILQLPEELRQVLQLAFLEGMTQSEIANQLNLPVEAVRLRMVLAMKQLRQLISH